MKAFRAREKGVGIVEVMIALVVIMISALAFSNIQTSTFINMKMSDTRFKVNERAQDMLEVLRANSVDARKGIYNVEFDDTIVLDSSSMPALVSISRWKAGIAAQLSQGGGKISCNDVSCMVSIRWQESVDGALTNQSFDLAGLM